MKSRFVLRARILSGIFILAAVLLVTRLYFLQIVKGEQYARDAMGQYIAQAPDTEERGDIFFREKDGTRVAAAVMQTGWRIAIKPEFIADAVGTYMKLNAITPIDEERFTEAAQKKTDPYEEVAFKVNDSSAAEIRMLKLPGVLLVQDKWRYYPGGTLAAHAIGFVGYQGDRKVGVYGLERYWQDTLAKKSDGLFVNPFAEIFANLEAILSTDPASHSGDVITSIEPAVEQRLEAALDGVMSKYSPKIVGGIVMDPRTGDIIALGARPTFNPNTYNTVSNPIIYKNSAVENIYEMGSIMKPLTIATAIDAGAITPSTTYNDRGFIMKSGKRISNFDNKGRGVVDMQEVLNQSLNTGAAYAVDAMGHEQFSKYVHELGLGEESGIDFQNEAAGFLQAIEKGSEVDYASASFGQGIAVSPIEMIRALSVLANRGALPHPHVVNSVRYDSGIARDISFPTQKQILKPETVETVATMLTTVFDKALMDGELKQEHYSIAAKTGTAQIAIPGGGGYYEDRYLHSFFGFFPSHDPKFIVFLYAIEPRGELYASRTLARPFLDIAKFLINYYNVPPDR
ncbi:MAG TPA: penicillin-binding protein 2 [Candidatus Paceibacterota bacterium]